MPAGHPLTEPFLPRPIINPYPPLELPPRGVEPVWWPINPAQQAALNCRAEILLMGGQSGGGKTQFLAADACQERENGMLRALLIRTTLEEMQELEDIQKRMYEPYGARWLKKRWRFPSGATIRPGYLAHDKHLNRYQGNPYSWLGIDESGQHPEHRIKFMIGWLAAPTHAKLRVRARLTSNPGGIGHGWQMKVFLRNRCPVHAPAAFEDDRPFETSVWPGRVYRGATWTDDSPVHKTTAFIPARLADNPLYGREKMESLLSQSKAIQQQLLYGCWCNAAGLYFDFMRPDMVVPYAEIGHQWWWQHLICSDYGYGNSAAAAGMYAINPNGRMFKIRERVERKMYAKKFAQAICKDGFGDVDFPKQGPQQNWLKKLRPRDPEPPRMQFCVMDQAMDQHKGTQGKSVFGEMETVFNAHGIGCVKAAHDPMGNAQVLYNGLANKGLVLTRDGPEMPLSYRSVSSRIVDERKAVKKIHGAWEDDVYDECLAEGTVVATENGAVAIECVVAGDRVWTRKGLRAVTWAGQTSADAAVLTLKLTGGVMLSGTGNHPVFVVGKGFVLLDEIQYGDNLLTWQNQRLSSTAGSRFAGTPKQSSRRIGTTLARAALTAFAALKTFTEKYSGIITDPSQRAFTCTTATKTPQIMTQETLNCYPVATTPGTTRASEWLSTARWSGPASTWTRFGRWLRLGMAAKRDEPGTASTAKLSPITASLKSSNVGFVESSILGRILERISFVPGSAQLRADVSPDSTISSSPALSAARSSLQTDSAHISFALARVLSVTTGGRSAVYNLSVDDCPEFFANGVLVHNCSYAYNTWRQNAEQPARSALADEMAKMREDGVDETTLARLAWQREQAIREEEKKAKQGVKLGRGTGVPKGR